MDPSDHEPAPPRWKSRASLAWLVAAVAGGFYLVTEHRAHLYGLLPYLALAACPLMHLFMHHGHHHGGHSQGHPPQDEAQGGSHDRRRQ